MSISQAAYSVFPAKVVSCDDAPVVKRPAPTTSPMTQAADLAEFEQQILPHLNAAYNLARWLMRNGHDAEDAVHDSFLRARRYFASFDGTDARAWLLGIVRNTCITALGKRRPAEMQELAPDVASPWQTPRGNPESELLTKENVRTLRGCIDALPNEYREVIVLRELEELSYKEIASIAGLAIGTVMSRLNRARKRLENCMKLATGSLA